MPLTYAQALASLNAAFTAWRNDPNPQNPYNTGYNNSNSETVTVGIRDQLIQAWTTRTNAGYTFGHCYSASVPKNYDFTAKHPGTGLKFNWHMGIQTTK